MSALGIAYSGRATRRTLLVGASTFSVLLLAVALSRWWITTVPLVALLGVASIIFTATANTRLQLVAPARLRGRVMSIYSLLFAGTTPIGSLILGALADRGGVQLAVGEMAAVCIAGVIAGLLYMQRTRARLLPETAIPVDLGQDQRPEAEAVPAGAGDRAS